MRGPHVETLSRLLRNGAFWIFLAGLAYACLLTQGLPLWDDDFRNWFSKIQDQSGWRLLFKLLSPVTAQPESWGFNERPLQELIYKLLHALFGYEAWIYFVLKDLALAGTGALIYLWGLRLVPQRTRRARLAAAAAALFFLLAPGPAASLVWHVDYAPVAELIFLSMTYVIWREIEATPKSLKGLPRWRDPAQRRWLIRWTTISLLAYLGYKCKADLKLLPVIMALYVLLARPRRQWAFFAWPAGLMGLLAVPWSAAVFRKLPPFVPGSGRALEGWMWQPASWARLKDFFWSGAPWTSWADILREPTLSLAAVLGPFLLLPIAAFGAWRIQGAAREIAQKWRNPSVTGRRGGAGWLQKPEARAALFVLLWAAAITAAVSSLPEINYFFRIRYGILPLVPLSIGLAGILGRVAEARAAKAKPLPRWAAASIAALLAVQCAVNLQRSLRYRHDLGQVMVAVDQVYQEIARRHPGDRLALLPDFLPYEYRPEAPALFREKQRLEDEMELLRGDFPEGRTWVVSWRPSLWERLEIVQRFSGCRKSVLVDRLYPCARGSGAWLLSFVPEDPEYFKGEGLRNRGDLPGARRIHEAFLARHPANPAGYFVLGYEAYGLKDYVRAEEAYGWLEEVLPDHLPIVWNHALSLEGLGQFREAIPRLAFILEHDPRNYLAFMHLYWDYRRDGREGQARDLLLRMKLVTPRKPARGVPCGPSDVGRSPGVPLPHCARLSARLLY